MKNERNLPSLLASNLVYYRKSAGLTQLDVAEKFNYSDKAISKWERGESAPDVFVLKSLADFYGISLSDFFSEKKKIYRSASWKKHTIITLLSFSLVWLIAAIIFVVGELLHWDPQNNMWMVWVFAAIPASIVLTVFMAIWGNRTSLIVSVSLINWSVATSIFVPLFVYNIADNSYLVFIIAIFFQVMIILWYFLKIPEFLKKTLKIKIKNPKPTSSDELKK